MEGMLRRKVADRGDCSSTIESCGEQIRLGRNRKKGNFKSYLKVCTAFREKNKEKIIHEENQTFGYQLSLPDPFMGQVENKWSLSYLEIRWQSN